MASTRTALVAAVFVFATTSGANPVPTPTLERRDTPSDYPYGDIYTNEPKYLGFDKDIPADVTHIGQIHDAFDMATHLVLAGLSSVIGNDVPFARFFDNGADDPDDSDAEPVTDVYDQIVDRSNEGKAKTLIASAVFNNVDWKSQCPETTGGIQKQKRAEGDEDEDEIDLGYSDNIDGVFNIHFCNQAYEYKAIEDIDYSTLDGYPSLKMESLARIMLHEFTHWDQIGPKSKVEAQIVDTNNNDKQPAYGPSRAHALVQENVGLCTINADNYAWHATNAYFAQKHGTHGDFTDPPGY